MSYNVTTADIITELRTMAADQGLSEWAEDVASALQPVMDVDPYLWTQGVAVLRDVYGVTLPLIDEVDADTAMGVLSDIRYDLMQR